MAGFFGYVGSVRAAESLNVRAVARVLLQRGATIRTIEDREADGRFVTVLLECGDAEERVASSAGNGSIGSLAPILLFDGPGRDVMREKLASVRDVDSFVTRELDAGSLHGGFAFGVWSRTHRTIAIGCDHAGLRPVYFRATESWFAFSTDVGALLASDLLTPRVSVSALLAYLRDGGVPDGCLVDGVTRLKPGSYIIVRPYTSSSGELRRENVLDESSSPSPSDLRDTIARRITPGEPVALVSREEGFPCETLLDAVRQAGAGSVVRLSLSANGQGACEAGASVGGNVIDLEDLHPKDVLDGVLGSWDQPIADGVLSWLAASRARRLGARLLLCDLVPAAGEPSAPVGFLARLIRREARGSPTLWPLFSTEEVHDLLGSQAVAYPEGAADPEPPWHRHELSSLTQIARAQSLDLCAPFVERPCLVRRPPGRPARPTARALPFRTLRSWILDHYATQGLDALQALAEAGILSSNALSNLWNRFRHDVEPRTTARIWALIPLGFWVRRHAIGGLAR